MTRFKSSARSRSTPDILILEPEKGQEVRTNELVTEADIEEGVKSELCDCCDTVPFTYAQAVSVTVDVA